MKKVLIGLFLGLFCCGAYSQTEVIDKDVQIGGLITEGYGKKLQFGSPKGNSDDVYFIRNNIESDRTDLILSLGDDDKDKFVIGRKFWNEAEFTQQFVFQTNGNFAVFGIFKSGKNILGRIFSSQFSVYKSYKKVNRC